MIRSQEIKKSRNIFKLIRIAIGHEKDYSLPAIVDWKGVIDISIEQGVDSIVVDGLHRIFDEHSDLSLEIDKPEYEDLKYVWFGCSLCLENEFAA